MTIIYTTNFFSIFVILSFFDFIDLAQRRKMIFSKKRDFFDLFKKAIFSPFWSRK